MIKTTSINPQPLITNKLSSYMYRHHHLPCLFFFFFFVTNEIVSLSYADPRISEAGLFCGLNRPPPNTSYIPIFVREMELLSQLVTAQNWGSYHVANSTPPIYGLAQCYHDLSHTDCLLCYAASRTRLPRCLPSTSSHIYLDGCFLRYDNYNFFNETTHPNHDTVNCTSSGQVNGSEAARLDFQRRVGELMHNVTETAVSNGGFGVMGMKGVYGLAQCWKTVSKDGCRLCLEKAGKELERCLPSREGRGLISGCYLRYSTVKFYSDEADKTKDHSVFTKIRVTVAIALAAAAFLMLSLFAAYAAYVRLTKLKRERKNLGQISNSLNKSGLNFKYETLEKATNYFDPSRKIGQGGAGSVFKGTLPNGKTVAVKRLFFSTRQWVDEFFNEVNLISRIQHRNLVKLLGCSIEGPESLLVYEYMPNKGLDQFVFDKDKIPVLDWKQRLDIIVGIAEGLAYLHEGSQLRIIHRDIKSSNILLDESLSPKIADFGLARHFAADKSHLSTGIAGTLGYMAPEYVVRGQLTEKADVYSFGVLVLEIVSGKRNIDFMEDSSSLLQTVWMLYKTDKLAEAIDLCLKDNFPAKETSRVLQIGLLCTQASASLRPSMAEVVQLLINEKCQIPMPNKPPFLSAKVLDPASSIRCYGTNSPISNRVTTIILESSTSTGSSSSMPSSDGASRSWELKQQ